MEDRKSFIPQEKGVLPRILLLDFSEEDATYLRDLGYEVIEGSTGFGNKPLDLPRHESEIEIIFWDTSNINRENLLFGEYGQTGFNNIHGLQAYSSHIVTLKRYFDRMSDKKGFVGIFLDDIISIPLQKLPHLLESDFEFKTRSTSTLHLNQHNEDDVWFDFYDRFVRKDNVKFAINWTDNTTNFVRYFEDEDDNIHAVTYRHFAIIPKIEDKQPALTYLLQDVLPHHVKSKDIFPDKYYYLWANKEEYLPSAVKKLREQNRLIADTAGKKIEGNLAKISDEISKSEYLSNMLIADDSELFQEDKKLSFSVQKVLENDLGFKVTNVDEMQLQVGESLKEDKWVEDNDFFALVEIKGTEKGAKANWIRQDLTAHIREFEVVKETTGINSMLIFNHERRDAPPERSTPFSGDTALIEFSKKSNICLVPVYELFKLVRDIKEEKVSKEEARELLKKCKGMFTYGTRE